MATMTVNDGSVVGKKQDDRLVIFASSLGTVFEWYDFYIYGTLGAILAGKFFAGVAPNVAFIFTLLAFAAYVSGLVGSAGDGDAAYAAYAAFAAFYRRAITFLNPCNFFFVSSSSLLPRSAILLSRHINTQAVSSSGRCIDRQCDKPGRRDRCVPVDC